MKVTVSLDINAALRLRSALEGLDGFEQVVPGVEDGPRLVRVPYRLGAERRAVVKNLNLVNGIAREFDEVRIALVKEFWPDLKPGESINPADDPKKFAEFDPQMQELIKHKDELALESLSADVLYSAGEIPTAVLAVLEENGLIVDDQA